MTKRRQRLGKAGEDLAQTYLAARGYRILERNVRFREGELDMVALDGEVLVFVEVRTRSSRSYGTAAESVTWRKQQKLRQLALRYWAERDRGGAVRFRIDVVAVEWMPGQPPAIRHIPYAL